MSKVIISSTRRKKLVVGNKVQYQPLQSQKAKRFESLDLSLCVRKPTIWVLTRSDTNQAVESQKMARGWKFWI